MSTNRVAIIVGGGPAPGINAVIGAATIEAVNQGFEVLGVYDGLRWLSAGDFDAKKRTVSLNIETVSRIHFDGGSILRTARTNLLDAERLRTSTRVAADKTKVDQTVRNLESMGITHLITIGGDDTMLSARFISEAIDGRIRIVHVPKTIDNDLPLEHDIPTFGFASARFLGTQIVKNLMQDSKTTGRWYLVSAMGRSAGWLAMGIGQSAGATLTLIPEEFGERTSIQCIADVIEGAMLKRRIMGRPDGVAVIAEGLAYRLGDPEELERMLGKKVPVDAAGHPRLSEIPLVDLLRRELQDRFATRGESMTIIPHDLGYELRSADPTPGDMGYCRSLGHGSIRLLQNDSGDIPPAVMVTLVNGNLCPVPLGDLVDPETNRTRVRLVDVSSDTYRVARAYMIRLEPQDLADEGILARLAAEAKMPASEFREQFRHAATRITDPPGMG